MTEHRTDPLRRVRGVLEEPPSNTLFVSDLPRDIKLADLENLFFEFEGFVGCRIRKDKTDSHVGFVDFRTVDHAVRAKKTLQGHKMRGSTLAIWYAKNAGAGPTFGPPKKRKGDWPDESGRDQDRDRDRDPRDRDLRDRDRDPRDSRDARDRDNERDRERDREPMVAPHFEYLDPPRGDPPKRVSSSNLLPLVPPPMLPPRQPHPQEVFRQEPMQQLFDPARGLMSQLVGHMQMQGLMGHSLQQQLPPDASPTLYVDNLPLDVKEREIAHIFRPFVGYKSLRIRHKGSKEGTRTICFVEFDTAYQAHVAALATNEYKFDGMDLGSARIAVQFAKAGGGPRRDVRDLGRGRGDSRDRGVLADRGGRGEEGHRNKRERSPSSSRGRASGSKSRSRSRSWNRAAAPKARESARDAGRDGGRDPGSRNGRSRVGRTTRQRNLSSGSSSGSSSPARGRIAQRRAPMGRSPRTDQSASGSQGSGSRDSGSRLSRRGSGKDVREEHVRSGNGKDEASKGGGSSEASGHRDSGSSDPMDLDVKLDAESRRLAEQRARDSKAK